VIAPERHPPGQSCGLFSSLEFLVLKLNFAIVALATTFIAAAAQAQLYDPKYPVCLHVFGELQGERMDCVFTSLAQCEASASGRPAMCVINPYFVRAPAPARRRHQASSPRG
jgi:hypothetical protein